MDGQADTQLWYSKGHADRLGHCRNTTCTLNTKDKQKKTAQANKTNYTLVWYAFYNLQQETHQALFLQPRSPHGAYNGELI